MNQERIIQLKKFISEDPEDPFNKYALAMEYYEQDSDQALQELRSLVSAHPDYLPTYFKLAHLLWEKEVWNEADRTFSEGIRLAKLQEDQKAVKELQAAYLNFQFDMD